MLSCKDGCWLLRCSTGGLLVNSAYTLVYRFRIQNEERLQRCSLLTLAFSNARFRERRSISLHAATYTRLNPASGSKGCAGQRCTANDKPAVLLVTLLSPAHPIKAAATSHGQSPLRCIISSTQLRCLQQPGTSVGFVITGASPLPYSTRVPPRFATAYSQRNTQSSQSQDR